MDFRDGHGQHAAGMLGQFGQLTDVTAYIIRLEHILTLAGQPMYQRVDLRLWRGDSDQLAVLGRNDRSALGACKGHEYIG